MSPCLVSLLLCSVLLHWIWSPPDRPRISLILVMRCRPRACSWSFTLASPTLRILLSSSAPYLLVRSAHLDFQSSALAYLINPFVTACGLKCEASLINACVASSIVFVFLFRAIYQYLHKAPCPSSSNYKNWALFRTSAVALFLKASRGTVAFKYSTTLAHQKFNLAIEVHVLVLQRTCPYKSKLWHQL